MPKCCMSGAAVLAGNPTWTRAASCRGLASWLSDASNARRRRFAVLPTAKRSRQLPDSRCTTTLLTSLSISPGNLHDNTSPHMPSRAASAVLRNKVKVHLPGFVEAGGAYLGLCAGAYYACSFVEFALGTRCDPRPWLFSACLGLSQTCHLLTVNHAMCAKLLKQQGLIHITVRIYF